MVSYPQYPASTSPLPVLSLLHSHPPLNSAPAVSRRHPPPFFRCLPPATAPKLGLEMLLAVTFMANAPLVEEVVCVHVFMVCVFFPRYTYGLQCSLPLLSSRRLPPVWPPFRQPSPAPPLSTPPLPLSAPIPPWHSSLLPPIPPPPPTHRHHSPPIWYVFSDMIPPSPGCSSRPYVKSP